MTTALFGLAASITSCGSAVQVDDVPKLKGADATACRQLVKDLPDEIGSQLKKRKVKPDDTYAAAWGKPAVVLRCGVGVPASYQPGVDLSVINNVGWFGDPRPNDVVYTALTRTPRVSVAVPRVRQSSFEILVDLSDAVTAHTKPSDIRPRG